MAFLLLRADSGGGFDAGDIITVRESLDILGRCEDLDHRLLVVEVPGLSVEDATTFMESETTTETVWENPLMPVEKIPVTTIVRERAFGVDLSRFDLDAIRASSGWVVPQISVSDIVRKGE